MTAVRASGSSTELVSGGSRVEFRLEQPVAIDVLVGADGAETRVLALELTRP